MAIQDKSKEELIAELLQLRQENISLKTSLVKETAEFNLEKDLLQTKMMNCDAVFESSPVPMFIIDKTTNITMVNWAAVKFCGGSEDEILQHRPGNALRCAHSSKDPRGCGYAPDCKTCKVRNAIEGLIEQGGSVNGAELEFNLERNGNLEKVWMNVGVEPLMKAGQKLWCIAMNDITKHKKTELQLTESQTLLNSIIDSTNDMIWSVDAERFGLLQWNTSFHDYFLNDRGIEIGIGMTPKDLFPPDSEFIHFWTDLFSRTLIEGSYSKEYETFSRTRILQINLELLCQNGKPFGISVFAKNITAQKKAETKLLKANRLYAVISQVNQAIVHIKDKDKLLKEICQIAIDFGNFPMAWIGTVDETTKLVEPHSVAGSEDGYLSAIRQIKASDTPEGRGPTGRCIREGKYAVCNDFANDPDLAIWRDEALKRNFYSAIALPIKQHSRVIGSFTLYASSLDFFDEQEIQLLTEIADDISFALDTIELERKHQQALTELVEKEEKYRRLTENMKDVVWIMDLETFRFTYISPSVEKHRGFTPEEIMSQPMDASLTPDQTENLRRYLNEQIALFRDGKLSTEHQYFTEEIIQPCKDGSQILAEVVSYFYLNPRTNKVELHGVTRNITERKRAEEKIRLSEEKFRAAFMTIKDGFYIGTLKEGIIVEVNSGFEDIFQYTPEESIGKTSQELGLWAIPEDRALMVDQLKEKGYCNNLETLSRKKNGELFHVSITTSVLNIDQTPHIVGVIRDITERKLTEEEIVRAKDRAEESEKKYHELFNEMIDGFAYHEIICDSAGNPIDYITLEVNKAYEKYLDLQGKSIFGRKASTFLSDEELRHWLEVFGAVAITGQSTSYKMYSPKNQKYFEGKAYCPEKGKFAVTFSDVTEKEIAERLIKEKEKEYRTLVENLSAGIVVHDANSVIVLSNIAACQILGLTDEQMKGRSAIDPTWSFTKEDLSVMPVENYPANMVLDKGEPLKDYILGVFRPDLGHFIWVICNGYPVFDQYGKINGAVITFTDITSAKNAEQEVIRAKGMIEESEYRLKLATASGKLGIWDWNLVENTMAWDERMFELYGITKDTFPNNVDAWLNGLHPDDKQSAINDCNAALSGEKEFNTSFRVLHPNGVILHLKADGSILRDAGGKPLRMIGINRDISEAKLAEEQLIMAKEKAEESDRLKSVFLANMSHEIRTPLNSIIGFSELLNDPYFDQKQKNEFTKTIIENGNNLLVIISDIMDLSMLEAQQIKIKKEQFPIKKLISDLENELHTKVCNKGLAFHLNLTPDQAKIKIENDYYRIRQILNNLVSNALKFTHNGFIEIGFSPIEEGIEFYVKDTGIGIAPEFHEDIFERFRQVDETKTRKYGGTGLGLAISKNLVEILGGKIWVESEVGKGSTFYFTIPTE